VLNGTFLLKLLFLSLWRIIANSERKRMKRNGEMNREIQLEKQHMLFMPFCPIDFTYVPERITA
jgi:hypothetical protein